MKIILWVSKYYCFFWMSVDQSNAVTNNFLKCFENLRICKSLAHKSSNPNRFCIALDIVYVQNNIVKRKFMQIWPILRFEISLQKWEIFNTKKHSFLRIQHNSLKWNRLKKNVAISTTQIEPILIKMCRIKKIQYNSNTSYFIVYNINCHLHEPNISNFMDTSIQSQIKLYCRMCCCLGTSPPVRISIFSHTVTSRTTSIANIIKCRDCLHDCDIFIILSVQFIEH